MTKLHLTPAVLGALAVAVPAAAEGTCYTTSTTGDEMVVVEIPDAGLLGGHFYVATDLCQDDEPEPDPDPSDPYNNGGGPCLFSLYSYQEGNGIPGLQRQDEGHDDVGACDGRVAGDVLTPY